MRIDPDTCDNIELLKGEIHRLQGVVEALVRTKSIEIREYTIWKESDNAVGIKCTSGEGGIFNLDKFHTAIDKFYDENF